MGDDGDSVDSDRVEALNLVTSAERISSNNNNNSSSHLNPSNNNNNNINGKIGNEKPNGHGQLGSPLLSPSPASIQAALAALEQGSPLHGQLALLSPSPASIQAALAVLQQAGPFSLNQVKYMYNLLYYEY